MRSWFHFLKSLWLQCCARHEDWGVRFHRPLSWQERTWQELCLSEVGDHVIGWDITNRCAVTKHMPGAPAVVVW